MLVARRSSPSPQPMLFSRLTDITPHIRFACFVGGKKLVAAVTHTEDTGTETLYHMSFSDGHNDAYNVARECSGQTVMRDTYLQAIADDLRVVHTLLEAGRQVLATFRLYHDSGESLNVWLEKRADTYRVYFKGQYQFHFRKREGWEVRTSRTEKQYRIDRELASLIEQQLDKLGL